jgi:hypothetical protein
MLKTFEIKIDIEKDIYNTTQILFTASRNDLDSIELQFKVVQDDEPFDLTGKTIELAILKPSGKTVFQDVQIVSGSDGKASVILTSQSYVEFGIHSAELYIRNESQMIVASPFYFASRDSIMNDDILKSTNEWGALQQALFLYDKKPLITEGVPEVVPEYVGQTALDTVNNLFFVANDTTIDSWIAIGTGEGGSGVVSWNTILNKPLKFPSEEHTHLISDIVGLQDAIDSKGGEMEDHTHDISDVIGLQDVLDSKVGEVELDSKADLEHLHIISEVNGLQNALDSKVDAIELDGKADLEHLHIISDVDGLQDALDTKASTSELDGKVDWDSVYLKNEVYNKNEVDQMTFSGDGDGTPSIIVEDTLTGTSSRNALSSNQGRILNEKKADVKHEHDVADVNGLQDALELKADATDLDAKADAIHVHTWDEIDLKPETFTPEQHQHGWDDITGKPEVFTPEQHQHGWDDITGKPEVFTPEQHQHGWDDITGKPEVFTPEQHQHGWDDITGKPEVFTPEQHQHGWDDITGKPEVFEADAHEHTSADITDFEIAVAEAIPTDYLKEDVFNTRMSGLSLWKGTQSEYDAIANKSSETLYFIIG